MNTGLNPLGDATLYAQCMFLSQSVEGGWVGSASGVDVFKIRPVDTRLAGLQSSQLITHADGRVVHAR